MGAPEITTQEVVELLDSGNPPLLIDVRSAKAYANGHIPGAVSIPAQEFDTRLLPDTLQLDDLIVVYCYMGVSSAGVASKLIELGFSNVFSMKGGHTAWRFTQRRPEDVKG